MTDTTTLERLRKLAGHPGNRNADAVAACLRTLANGKGEAEKWVSLTRAVNKATNPEKVVAALESLLLEGGS